MWFDSQYEELTRQGESGQGGWLALPALGKRLQFLVWGPNDWRGRGVIIPGIHLTTERGISVISLWLITIHPQLLLKPSEILGLFHKKHYHKFCSGADPHSWGKYTWKRRKKDEQRNPRFRPEHLGKRWCQWQRWKVLEKIAPCTRVSWAQWV